MSQSISAPVLVLGGGPAGMAAAVELAEKGLKSVIVEREGSLGGLAAGMACKATDECARCGVCLADDLRAEVGKSGLIKVLTGTELGGYKPGQGGFEALLRDSSGGQEKLTVLGLVAAVGASPINPGIKSQFGYGILENIISGLELEAMVRREQAVKRPSDGQRPKRIGFVQCVGSRDISVGRGKGGFSGCSRICCGYTARLASWIAAHQPETEITIFYMDLQSIGRDPAGLLEGIRDKAEFVRAIPGQVEQTPGGGLKLGFKPEYEPSLEIREVDLLVLSTGLAGPGEGAFAELQAGLEADLEGYLSAPGADRVVVAGAAGGPLGIAEAVKSGRRAGLLAAAWKGGAA